MEGLVRSNIKALFGRQGLGKRIGHIGAKDEKIFSRQNSIENYGASLIYAVGVSIVQNPNLAQSRQSITCTLCLLPFINLLNDTCPDKVEHSILRGDMAGNTKHTLCIVLV
jgi:hypothetical protein